jgi:DNA-binding FrmR family transcriptional regulator
MHATHPHILPRLRRAEGHLRSVIGMIEDGRPCLAIAQQLHAVEAAIAKAKQALIHDHIEHCLAESEAPSTNALLADLRQLAKHL